MTQAINSPANVYGEVGPTDAATPFSAFLQGSGSDFVFATTGAIEGVCIEDSGDYALVDLGQTFIVADGSDAEIDATGPADWVIVADGDDIALSTDLADEPAGAMHYDLAGNLYLVHDALNRREAVMSGSDIILY